MHVELQHPGVSFSQQNPLELCVQCVRLHRDGRVATVFLKRRDLLRLFALDPRDMRRIDPHLPYTRSSPTLSVQGNVVLVQLAGVRLIITAHTALVLDPHHPSSRQFLSDIIPKLQVAAGQKLMQVRTYITAKSEGAGI